MVCAVDGALLLAASSLAGRCWQGSLWVYTDPKLAPSEGFCKAGVQTEAGVTDARWISERSLLLASDAGTETHSYSPFTTRTVLLLSVYGRVSRSDATLT